MPQHSFLTRKDGDLLALLAILLLYPKTPVQKGTYIPRSPDLRRAFYKALPRQALHTQEMTWYRGSVSVPSGLAACVDHQSMIGRLWWQFFCDWFLVSLPGSCFILLP